MREIRKIYLVIITLVVAFFSTACEEVFDFSDDDLLTSLEIYTINDFHGTLFENGSSKGIAKLGEYLINKKNENPDSTLIISAGDMFQGTAVSSMTRGKSVVDAMNIIGFDAMTIGNHEFDWGIDEVLKYQDGDLENGEANFPFLAANILDKRTGELASWAKPYTVVQKGDIKVGIIGVIGRDQTNDILASYVENYEFTREIDAITKYTKILRTEEKCDIVIVSAHLDTSRFNVDLGNMYGNERIDAIINGHTHQAYYGDVQWANRDVPLPYVQSGCYGRYIGYIKLEIYNKTKEVLYAESNNIEISNISENQEIKNAINMYSAEIKKSEEVLGISGEYISKDRGGQWASNVIQEAGNALVGIVNSGGIRSNGFPINENQEINYGDVFEIMPFENKVITVEIKGSQIMELFTYEGLYISDNVQMLNDVLTINGEVVEANKYYKVATVDFLYEKNNYPFKYGQNSYDTNILFRDALASDVKEKMELNGKFTTYR